MNKILLVEDDELMIRMYQRMFEVNGFEVTVTTNGVDALEAVKKVKYNAIILDIMMPKMDGLTALKKLRADTTNANLPIVVLTNLNSESTLNEAFAAGANQVLVKSDVDNKELLKTIQDIVKQA